MENEDKIIDAEIVEENSGDSTGSPIPTDELNPNNKSGEHSNGNPISSFSNLFGGGSFSDYEPLLKLYVEAIDQQGKNIEYLKSLIERMCDEINKSQNKIWKIRAYNIILTIVVILIAILK